MTVRHRWRRLWLAALKALIVPELTANSRADPPRPAEPQASDAEAGQRGQQQREAAMVVIQREAGDEIEIEQHAGQQRYQRGAQQPGGAAHEVARDGARFGLA